MKCPLIPIRYRLVTPHYLHHYSISVSCRQVTIADQRICRWPTSKYPPTHTVIFAFNLIWFFKRSFSPNWQAQTHSQFLNFIIMQKLHTHIHNNYIYTIHSHIMYQRTHITCLPTTQHLLIYDMLHICTGQWSRTFTIHWHSHSLTPTITPSIFTHILPPSFPLSFPFSHPPQDSKVIPVI